MLRKQISITYSHRLTQLFFVVSHDDEYLKTIKPLEQRQYEIESLNKNQRKKHKIELDTINTELAKFNFKWCTEKSPVFKSVETQLLSLLPQQGGDISVISKFI